MFQHLLTDVADTTTRRVESIVAKDPMYRYLTTPRCRPLLLSAKYPSCLLCQTPTTDAMLNQSGQHKDGLPNCSRYFCTATRCFQAIAFPCAGENAKNPTLSLLPTVQTTVRQSTCKLRNTRLAQIHTP